MPYAYTAYLYKNIKDNRRHNVSCISRFCNYFSKNVVDLDVNTEVSRYLKNLCADNDTRKTVDNIVDYKKLYEVVRTLSEAQHRSWFFDGGIHDVIKNRTNHCNYILVETDSNEHNQIIQIGNYYRNLYGYHWSPQNTFNINDNINDTRHLTNRFFFS